MSCEELELAREFNAEMNTGKRDTFNYRKIRKMMNEEGLIGMRWHVGHVEPNEPGSERDHGAEDLGQNLMA